MCSHIFRTYLKTLQPVFSKIEIAFSSDFELSGKCNVKRLSEYWEITKWGLRCFKEVKCLTPRMGLFLIFDFWNVIINMMCHPKLPIHLIGMIQKVHVKITELILCLQCFDMVNEMEVNIIKSKYINVDYNGFEFPFQLNFTLRFAFLSDETAKFWKEFFLYLGTTLAENFSFQQQIFDLHKKLVSSIRQVCFLRNRCCTSLLQTLYFALIKSRWQYYGL